MYLNHNQTLCFPEFYNIDRHCMTECENIFCASNWYWSLPLPREILRNLMSGSKVLYKLDDAKHTGSHCTCGQSYYEWIKYYINPNLVIKSLQWVCTINKLENVLLFQQFEDRYYQPIVDVCQCPRRQSCDGRGGMCRPLTRCSHWQNSRYSIVSFSLT